MELELTPVWSFKVKPLPSYVKVFTIQHLYDLLLECNSVPQVLHRVNTGLILAEFADCSVRLLDVGSDRVSKREKAWMKKKKKREVYASLKACTLNPLARGWPSARHSRVSMRKERGPGLRARSKRKSCPYAFSAEHYLTLKPWFV
eukprot:scaffold138639_cov21-Tisochrysis_lutea.AAC.2